MGLRTKPRKEWEIKLEGSFEVERLLELKEEILGALEQCEDLRLN